MSRVKTFVNGGSLLPGDLNSIEDDYEFAFSTYETIGERISESPPAPVAGTFLLGGTTGQSGLAVVPQALVLFRPFYLDPADLLANTRTTKYRVRAQVITNATATGTNWTFGLYPIATYSGTSGNSPGINTLGTVVTGSTVAFNTPGASSQNQGNSGDFTAPAAGFYVFAVVNSAPSASGSVVFVRAVLQSRQV